MWLSTFHFFVPARLFTVYNTAALNYCQLSTHFVFYVLQIKAPVFNIRFDIQLFLFFYTILTLPGRALQKGDVQITYKDLQSQHVHVAKYQKIKMNKSLYSYTNIEMHINVTQKGEKWQHGSWLTTWLHDWLVLAGVRKEIKKINAASQERNENILPCFCHIS